ncbi:MAG TPA: hypothetical protein PKI62_11605 [bacterium]|nr:hypothetical protein [bacterium]HPR88037.1 hypothetical protein [bacterium]
MKRTFLLLWLLGSPLLLLGQGITRSHGLGVRLSFWNMMDQNMRFTLDASAVRGSVDLSGVGFWLSYQSRIQRNWFMLFDLATVASIHSDLVGERENDAHVSTVIPLLLGFRHYPYGGRLRGSLQPYFGVGAGPYYVTDFNVKEADSGMDVHIEGSGKTFYGGYASAGAQLHFTSWLALTFDTRYHFVDWRSKGAYSGPEFGIGMTLMWGRSQEMFQVLGSKLIVENLYPAYYQFYNTYPLALVTVRNLTGSPIEINVRSNIEGYTPRPRESGFIRLAGHETRDIPVTVLFGPKMLEVENRTPAVLDLVIEGRAGTTLRKTVSAGLTIHQRNAWDGDMQKLKFYITADDPQIIKECSALTANRPGSREPEALATARAIFDHLSQYGLRYRRDPNIPFYKDDRVLYPRETLQAGGGDCDDLTVLLASYLESAGYATAFVEVRDPGKEMAHLYLLFSTGLGPVSGELISSNEKRYIARTAPGGETLLWIPLECTLLGRSFEESWMTGASQYLDEAVLRNGLAEGWVTIIDVD